MKNKNTVSVIINVRNEAENLSHCLKSVKGFADEVIVVDMHSTDNSYQVATSFGAKVFPYRWMKVVEPARNFAISKASSRWVLILDPDERVGRSLKKELKRITLRSDIDYVKIPRMNYIFGKWMRHANCWPDYLIRFFKKGSITWKKEIHSQPVTKGNGITLLDSDKLAIKHTNYTTVTQFIQRAIRYSSVKAEELQHQEYKLKTSDLILKPVQEFNSRFFAGEGYKDGMHGLVFSLLQSLCEALIYIRLWEKQGKLDKPIAKESFVSASQETAYEYDHWFTKYYLNVYSPFFLKKVVVRIRHFFFRLTKEF